ncbi:uncharacterized protein RCO7_02715 [Rhynchosporium graminicola]|uniref:Uncharacterized protein n=1 Tax=Rhynchosporium graminicola TaxID=2792576 RepID=A0A1E1KG03_9HELO|nr:uncharacterized protein RCO7_02715 [Rhynchosporium commune]
MNTPLPPKHTSSYYPQSSQLLQPSPRNSFKRNYNGGCGPAYVDLRTRDANGASRPPREPTNARLFSRGNTQVDTIRSPRIRESASKPKDLSAFIIQDLTNLGTRKDKAGNDVPETQFSTGTAELKGCTTLYITSHKGVFAAHYWENVSFDPDDIWLARGDDIWTPEAKAKIFKTTVLDPLKHGSKYHPRLRAKTLEGEYIRAYLIVPDTKWR